MPTRPITDPEELKRLDAPPEAPKEQGRTRPTIDPAVRDAPTPTATDFAKKYAPGFAYGAAQSGAGLLDLNVRLGDLAAQKAGEIPYVGPVAKGVARTLFVPGEIAGIMPQEWKDKIHTFANEPSTRPGQTAGYVTGEIAPLVLGGGGVAAKMGKEGVADIAGGETLWQLAHYVAPALDHALGGYGHVTGWAVFRLLRHAMTKIGKTTGKEAEKESPKGAAEAAAKGTAKTATEAAKTEKPTPKEPKEPKESQEPPQKRTTKLPGVFPWDQ